MKELFTLKTRILEIRYNMNIKFKFNKIPAPIYEVDEGIRNLVKLLDTKGSINPETSCEGHPNKDWVSPEWGHIGFTVREDLALEILSRVNIQIEALNSIYSELSFDLALDSYLTSKNPIRRGSSYTHLALDISSVVKILEEGLGICGDHIIYSTYIHDENLFDIVSYPELKNKVFMIDYCMGVHTRICGENRPVHVVQALEGKTSKNFVCKNVIPAILEEKIDQATIEQIYLSFQPKTSKYDANDMKAIYRRVISNLEGFFKQFP